MTWSVPITLAAAQGAVSRTLTADPETRARLARELGLLALDNLDAQVETRPWFDGAELSGTWKARIAQSCGVTLERLESELSGDFTVQVVPDGSIHASAAGGEEEFDPDALDPPDVITDGQIDLAAYVVEHLALEIDPFPRKPGAEFVPPDPGPDLSPFAALKALRKDDPS